MKVNLTNLEISATLSNEHVLNATLEKGGYSENEDSVAAGKAMVAAAISNKGIKTKSTASFDEMAKNINKLGGGGAVDAYALKDVTTKWYQNKSVSTFAGLYGATGGKLDNGGYFTLLNDKVLLYDFAFKNSKSQHERVSNKIAAFDLDRNFYEKIQPFLTATVDNEEYNSIFQVSQLYTYETDEMAAEVKEWLTSNFKNIGSNGAGAMSYITTGDIAKECRYIWVYQNSSNFNASAPTSMIFSNNPYVGGAYNVRYNNGLTSSRLIWKNQDVTTKIYFANYNGSSWLIGTYPFSTINTLDSIYRYNGGYNYETATTLYGSGNNYAFSNLNYTGAKPLPPVKATTHKYVQAEMNSYNTNDPYGPADYNIAEANIFYDADNETSGGLDLSYFKLVLPANNGRFSLIDDGENDPTLVFESDTLCTENTVYRFQGMIVLPEE